ncbi:hypothetical protein DSO57_1001772 [Entomophthora muscae]|uniref:Uncharacterized protein n=1 Tax=Entomophthora muscae TaxID=34485 RepID=A0ACC2T8U7_9FUNG|nr:hypothetical protein DSO57_1001772 [Entomophthora muscae]
MDVTMANSPSSWMQYPKMNVVTNRILFLGFEPQTHTDCQLEDPDVQKPKFFGLKSRIDSTLEKPLNLTNEAQTTCASCLFTNPSGLANRSAHVSNIIMTSCPVNRVLHEFPQKQDPPDDGKSYVLKKKIKIPHSNPANDEMMTSDATKDLKTLVNATTKPKEF